MIGSAMGSRLPHVCGGRTARREDTHPRFVAAGRRSRLGDDPKAFEHDEERARPRVTRWCATGRPPSSPAPEVPGRSGAGTRNGANAHSSAMSFVTSTSSSAITRISMPSTDITSPRGDQVVIDRHALRAERSDRRGSSPSQALTSHSSGGCSVGHADLGPARPAPAALSAGLMIRSRSWRLSGPPRAQLARLPPSRYGTSAARNAAPDFFNALSKAKNGGPGSCERATRRRRPGSQNGYELEDRDRREARARRVPDSDRRRR